MSHIERRREARAARRGEQEPEVIEGQIVGRPPMPRDIRRATERAVAKNYARGVEKASKLRATHYVATTGMLMLTELEREEGRAAAADPMNAGHRHKRIVDAFGDIAVQAVWDTGRGEYL